MSSASMHTLVCAQNFLCIMTNGIKE
jgi:hypothetical protein